MGRDIIGSHVWHVHKGLLSPEIAKMPSDGRVYLAVGMAMWHGAAAFIFMLGRVVRVSNLYRLS